MAKKQLKIKLLPNGKIEMKTVGIKGKKCLGYVELFKLLADIKIEKQELTSEYYEDEQTVQENSNQEIKFD